MSDNIKSKKIEEEVVELIAAGYEWTCPDCDELNCEIEITEQVTCAQCKRVFKVMDAYHAHE